MKIGSSPCSRRKVLKIAASTTLVTITSSLSIGCSPKIADMDTVAKQMIDVLNYPINAREIGTRYLSLHRIKQPPSARQLTKELLQTLNLRPDSVSVDSLQSIGKRLSAQVRQDFIDEDVVILDRWMLSKTELSLCVLATISS